MGLEHLEETCTLCCVSSIIRHVLYMSSASAVLHPYSIHKSYASKFVKSGKKTIVQYVLNLMSQTSKCRQLLGPCPQTPKNFALGTDQQWKETNENLHEMLCLKYQCTYVICHHLHHHLQEGKCGTVESAGH